MLLSEGKPLFLELCLFQGEGGNDGLSQRSKVSVSKSCLQTLVLSLTLHLSCTQANNTVCYRDVRLCKRVDTEPMWSVNKVDLKAVKIC